MPQANEKARGGRRPAAQKKGTNKRGAPRTRVRGDRAHRRGIIRGFSCRIGRRSILRADRVTIYAATTPTILPVSARSCLRRGFFWRANVT